MSIKLSGLPHPNPACWEYQSSTYRRILENFRFHWPQQHTSAQRNTPLESIKALLFLIYRSVM